MNDQGQSVVGEQGLPVAAINQGYRTSADWQYAQQQQLSDKQIAAQRQIADQTQAYNQQQLDYQRQQADEQTRLAHEQAQRQTDYDTGRAHLLSDATSKVNDAFSQFSPEYFKSYAKSYMDKAADDINYQQRTAQKAQLFGLAGRGVLDSQSAANQAGLLQEERGRALATQTANATQAANQLQSNVAQTKGGLLSQVQNAENIASPIAGGSTEAVGSAIDTTRSALSGVTNTSGDIVASLKGVPTVSPLSSVFAGTLGAAGSYLGGVMQNTALNKYYTASGTNPSGVGNSVTNKSVP